MKKCDITLFVHCSDMKALRAGEKGVSVMAWNHPSRVKNPGVPVNMEEVVKIRVDITATNPLDNKGNFAVCLAGFNEG